MLRPTQVPTRNSDRISRTGLSPSAASHSRLFRYASLSLCRRSYNPGTRVATTPVWALPRSIASTGGIVFTFSSCGYLDVSVPRVRPMHSMVTGSLPPGCPIRISTGHRIFAPLRGFSQLVTSFFASESQGIPHAPLSIPFFLLHRLALVDYFAFDFCLAFSIKHSCLTLQALVVFELVTLVLSIATLSFLLFVSSRFVCTAFTVRLSLPALSSFSF